MTLGRRRRARRLRLLLTLSMLRGLRSILARGVRLGRLLGVLLARIVPLLPLLTRGWCPVDLVEGQLLPLLMRFAVMLARRILRLHG